MITKHRNLPAFVTSEAERSVPSLCDANAVWNGYYCAWSVRPDAICGSQIVLGRPTEVVANWLSYSEDPYAHGWVWRVQEGLLGDRVAILRLGMVADEICSLVSAL